MLVQGMVRAWVGGNVFWTIDRKFVNTNSEMFIKSLLCSSCVCFWNCREGGVYPLGSCVAHLFRRQYQERYQYVAGQAVLFVSVSIGLVL